MDDKRFASLLLLVTLGAAFLLFALNASGAFAAELSQAVSGSPGEKAAWRAASGATVAGLGLFGLLGARKG